MSGVKPSPPVPAEEMAPAIGVGTARIVPGVDGSTPVTLMLVMPLSGAVDAYVVPELMLYDATKPAGKASDPV